jgi:hypothetical protein
VPDGPVAVPHLDGGQIQQACASRSR